MASLAGLEEDTLGLSLLFSFEIGWRNLCYGSHRQGKGSGGGGRVVRYLPISVCAARGLCSARRVALSAEYSKMRATHTRVLAG